MFVEKFTWVIRRHKLGFMILILLAVVTSLISRYSYVFEKIPLMENETVLCTTFVSGLGNNIFKFASSFAIARSKNMSLMIDENASINSIFKLNVKFAQSERFCRRQPSRVEKDGLYASYDTQLSNFTSGQNLRIGEYLQSWKYFRGYEKQIREQLTFNDDVMMEVNRTYAKIFSQFRLNSRKDVAFVGVHVRRDDMVNNELGFTVAGDDYLQKAINLTLKRYRNIIYIVVSKDMKWTKANFPRYVNSVFVHGKRAFDMAMLASCDHTIMTVGTYGWWSAWLAGGDVIYFKEPAVRGSWWYKKLNPDDHFYPQWTGLK